MEPLMPDVSAKVVSDTVTVLPAANVLDEIPNQPAGPLPGLSEAKIVEPLGPLTVML